VPESPEEQASIIARLKSILRTSNTPTCSPTPASTCGSQINEDEDQQEQETQQQLDHTAGKGTQDNSDRSSIAESSSIRRTTTTSSSSMEDSGSSNQHDNIAAKDSTTSTSSSSSSRKLQDTSGGRKKKSYVSRGPLQQSLTFLENDGLKIGVDLERAGAISWISSSHMPGTWKDKNLVNTWDNGRLLQQSFYGCKDSSCWLDKPWLWNPVQAGSWQNMNGETKASKVVKDKAIHVTGHPR
jgi:hypothetical protein